MKSIYVATCICDGYCLLLIRKLQLFLAKKTYVVRTQIHIKIATYIYMLYGSQV